jgi:N-acetylglucosaminyldiphosphoundecaprenol N-acetyl-beta-D-mannosaminyltransferase
MTLDALTMQETLDVLLSWCWAERGEKCRFVVTPNADHAVMFQTNDRFRAAYADAALVLADGAPVVVASRLLRRALPERVPGSDLAPALFKRVSRSQEAGSGEPGAGSEEPENAAKSLHFATRPATRHSLSVFLLGAAPGVADRAAANIAARWPEVKVVGTLSPPLGFERDAAENDRILTVIARARPDLLLVGLGAPKQELWVHEHAVRLDAKVALCVGATIDFLAGEKQRAPRWMRRFGLEWLHRLSTEPGRLLKRYVRDAWIFPQLVWRDWRGC